MWPNILTGLFITMIILAVPIGKMVDKFNRKVPLMSGYLAFAMGILLFLMGDLIRIFLALILFGLANVMVNSAYSALEADLTPKRQRGKVMGFTSFASYIVMAIGNLTGGVLYEHVSPQLPFIFTVVFLLPSIILTLLKVHEPEERQE